MDLYLTEQTFSHLLKALSIEIKKYYASEFPVIVGVGISGIEIAGRLPDVLGDTNIETAVCDVKRTAKSEIEKVTGFPKEKVAGKKVLIAYVRVDTGKTLRAVSKIAFEAGATDVKTLSIAVRNSACCFPHFFCFMIKGEDSLYLFLDGYPPDIESAYPPVLVTPGNFIRELSVDDTSLAWFKCGDERIDKTEVGEYLYYLKISKKSRIFVVDSGNKVDGILHFTLTSSGARIETFAVDKELQGKGIGMGLMMFFIDYCKFHSIQWINLDAFEERAEYYISKLGFERVKKFEVPTYGKFVKVRRRVF